MQTVIKATNQVNLLFRLIGVTDCPGLDQFCVQAGQRTQHMPSEPFTVSIPSLPSALPSSPSLVPSASSLASLASLMSLVSATSAMSITPDYDSPPTLVSSTSAMSITPADSIPATLALTFEHPTAHPGLSPPSPFPELPSVSPLPATQADTSSVPGLPSGHATTSLAPSVDDLDYLWLLGKVYTPPLDKKAWPAGIYARDMAQAFSMLGNTGDDTGLKERFEHVFQGRPFKSATYHAQRFAWLHSTQEQREWVMGLPRTKEGLWTSCRRKLSGWKQLPAHQ